MKDTVAVSEDDSNLLVLIIDTNPFIWAQSAALHDGLSLDEALNQILIFINAHLAFKHDNKLAVIASHVGKSKFLYPTSETIQTTQKSLNNASFSNDANMYQTFRAVHHKVILGVKKLVQDFESANLFSDSSNSSNETAASSIMAGAMSMALCYINRTLKADDIGRIKPRILVISLSPDSPDQYVAIMNCIFSAQKSSIPIDVCKVFGEDTVFLQQAAHITNGTYMKLDLPRGFLQYLLQTFLPDRYSRTILCLPGKEQVDFRAACFCHKKIIDIGYVCSVCLSIFCEQKLEKNECSTCRTPLDNLYQIPTNGVAVVNGIKQAQKNKLRETTS
ncbi:hypothetical protein G9A89_001474 [Geosiphon pyriformis]|nr:hypothetical protein G9A89_001474 [Geosiphon pyriformis]